MKTSSSIWLEGYHCTYPGCLTSWLDLTLRSNRCFLSLRRNTSEARLYSNPNPFPRTSTIDLVVREARLRIQCLHAFMRRCHSLMHQCLVPPDRVCCEAFWWAWIIISWQGNLKLTEPGTAFLLVRHRDPLVPDYVRASLLHSVIDLRHGSPPRHCALLAIVHGESAVEVVREWN